MGGFPTIEAKARNLCLKLFATAGPHGGYCWLQPYLEDELKRLGNEGVSNVVVVPISFVSDHIETLFELDQLYAGVAKEHGITNYHRARCFNGDPMFSQLLYSLLTGSDGDIPLLGNNYQTEFAGAVTAMIESALAL